MSGIAQNARPDFWLPHSAEGTQPALTACSRCGAEFMIAAQFCHICGTARYASGHTHSGTVQKSVSSEFNVLETLGLPCGLALCAGVGCLVFAIGIGLVYPDQNFADFESIQFWRMEWLMGAVAAFALAILLKPAPSNSK